MKQQLDELEQLKEANSKAEADKIKAQDLDQGKNLMDVEKAGSEGPLKDRELNLLKWMNTEEQNSSEAKHLRNGSRQNKRKRRLTNLLRGGKKLSSGSSQGHHMTTSQLRSSISQQQWKNQTRFGESSRSTKW